MAEAIAKLSEPVVEGVSLHLSIGEAKALRAVFRRVGGGIHTRRSLIADIDRALTGAGIPVGAESDSRGSVYFL